jgi:hypothetical protein
MSEIQDLGHKPETAPLRPAQVALYLKQHNAERPCEACGGTKHTMWPERSGEEGLARGLVMLACDSCNCLRSWLRPPIVQWLESARHG